MLRFAGECLKPDGQIMVATGSRILVPFKKPLSNYFSENPADTHCFRWSEKTLARVLNNSDFWLQASNDHVQSDCLIMVGGRGYCIKAPFADRATAVIDFFNRWDREFP